jgi:Ala-tRNA(Pro) deacylase
MPAKELQAFLDKHDVRYLTIRHSPAFTAQEIAASAHIPGREMAKTVILSIDGELAMAVLPAPLHVDLDELRRTLGASSVELANEAEFKDRFPDCELGAMPPFGNLYGMKVFVAAALAEDEQIAFNACSHTELIRMPYAAFVRLVNPVVLRFSQEPVL